MFPHPSIGVVKFATAIKATNYSALVLMIAVIGLGKAFSSNDGIRDGMADGVVALLEKGQEHDSSFLQYYLGILAGVPIVWLIATSAASSLNSTIFVQASETLGLDPKLMIMCAAVSHGVDRNMARSTAPTHHPPLLSLLCASFKRPPSPPKNHPSSQFSNTICILPHNAAPYMLGLEANLYGVSSFARVMLVNSLLMLLFVIPLALLSWELW